MERYAILVECDQGNTLGGSCTRDVNNLADVLIERHFFRESNVYKLSTVNGTSKKFIEMFDKVNSLSPDLIVILLSGHGYFIQDVNADETDGRDEAVNIGYQLIDDEIYNKIVKKIKCPAVLFTGTMFDLPYVYNPMSKKFAKDTKRKEILHNGKIISLAACADNQLSMCDIGETVGYGGSLTVALLETDTLCYLLSMVNYDDVYTRIKNRLSLLGQTLVLSSSGPN
jgi:Caspase domain